MLIGLNGFKGSGKSTAGEYLRTEYGFEVVAFADALKNGVANLFGISRRDVDNFKEEATFASTRGEVLIAVDGSISWSFTWREFLQRFGTEMARNTWGDDFWIRLLFDKLVFAGPARNVAITDARFENELRAINSAGGYNIRITRPGYESDGHASEVAPNKDLIATTIANNGSIPELYEMVDHAMSFLSNAREA